MITGLLEHVELWLNAFPSNSAEIKNVSPATLVTGAPQPDFNRKRVPFRSCVMAYKGTRNDMSARSTPAIALRESNEFGGFYFLSLESGNRFHSKKWDTLPISSQTIDRVHQLANDDNQPTMSDDLLVFETAPGVVLQFNSQDKSNELDGDENENASISTGDEGDAGIMANLALENNHALISEESEDMHAEDDTRCEDENQSHHIQNEDNNSVMSDDFSFNLQNVLNNENDDDNSTNEQTSQSDEDTVKSSETSQTNTIDIETSEGTDIHTAETENESDEIVARALQEQIDKELENREDLSETVAVSRPRRENAGAGVERLDMSFKGRGYKTKRNTLLLTERVNDDSYMRDRVMSVVFTQMSAYKGIKKHGEKAVAAVFKEFQQLDSGVLPGNPVVTPQDPAELTTKDLEGALEAVNLIKEKRNGDLKGCISANGAKQRKFLWGKHIVTHGIFRGNFYNVDNQCDGRKGC